MNCREYIIEFEDRADLGEAATLHLTICADCRQTTERQKQIWLMLEALPVIDAPKNFDFSVKARLANAQPSDFQPRFLPILRYVLPLSVVVLVFGILAFNTSLFFGDNAAPPVAEIVPAQFPITETSTDTVATVEKFTVAENPLPVFADESLAAANPNQTARPFDRTAETQFVVAKSTNRSPNETRRRAPKNDAEGIGNRVLSVTPTEVLSPENLDPNKKVEILPNAGNASTITDEKIWSFIGIEIVRENDFRKVKTVAPKSYAERSGVQVGDVIEAIDGVKLSAAPIRVNTFEGKSLTVARGREKIEITLENKPNQ